MCDVGHAVKPLASLRRDNPIYAVSPNGSALCQLDAAHLSNVHDILHLLLQCSYKVARCQAQRLLLTCSHITATLWHMAKSKKKGTAKAIKDEVVRFRASAEQKQAFEEAASREGLEVSAWLRQLALRAAGVLREAK